MPTPPDSILLTVSGQRYTGWEGLSITRFLDEVSSIAFSTSWDPSNRALAQLFVPLARQEIEVDTGRGERLLTGLITAGAPTADTESRMLPLGGFGLPGLLDLTRLNDTEFNKVKLDEVARKIAQSAGDIPIDFRADPGAVFEQAKLEHNKSPWSFLVDLARPRGVLLADSPAGQLLAWQAESGEPVMELEEGKAPCGEVSVTLGSDWHAEIVGYAGAKRGRTGSSHREKNPFFVGSYPTTHEYEESDTKPADLPRAVKAKLGRMLGSAISWTVTLPGLRDPSGALFAPNTIVRLLHPSTFLYRATDLLVRAVTYEISGETLSSTLTLVLPGSYSGVLPEAMPWAV